MTETFYMADTEAERYSPFGKEFGSFIPSYPTPTHSPKRNKDLCP